MKIENTGPLRPGNLRKASSLSRSGKGDFLSQLELEEARSSQVSEASPLTSLDTLFILQEVSSEEAPYRKALKKASSLLDRLEEIRLALLEGRLSFQTLDQLQALIQEEQKNVSDPQIKEILEEIELRARVEMAKLNR